MLIFKRKKPEWERIYNFRTKADKEIIAEIIDRSFFKRKFEFEHFLAEYQIRHIKKHGRKLRF